MVAVRGERAAQGNNVLLYSLRATGQGKRHSADAGGAGALRCYTRALPSGGVVTGCSFIIPKLETHCTKEK